MSTPNRGRIRVRMNGEEVEVWNHVRVQQEHHINSVNGYETFTGSIFTGDGGREEPDFVTSHVSALLWEEFGIEVKEHGIEEIDVGSEEVTVL